MASNKIDARQSRLTSAQGMLGSLSGDTLDTIFPKINDEIAKLFEDRNALLTDGGIITFTGTALQFTESLKISLNSKIDGSVQVFDLGSTTRSLSASGRMIYAVINRTAGTATVTADATALPAVTSANQEVFLIAKRVDATDGTQRVYFRNGSGLNAGQSVRLGASGTGGSGSGTGDDLNALTFKASFTDVFEDIPTASTSAVDTAAGKTDATLYSAVNALFQLNYDASRTVTGTGTSMNLSGTPSFTVKVGDILVVGTEARRITVVTTQTSYTIESAFTTNPTATQATISQAVYSKDINNFAGDGLAISSAFSSTISQIMTTYEDTSAQGDKIFDANTAPVIGFSASSDGTSYSSVQTRATNLSDSISLVNLPSAGTNLYLRFFANKTSGTGTVNILGYKVFLHRDNYAQDGSQINQSYGLTNGAGTEINISSIGVVGGKTRIKKTWSYPVGVNAGTTNGSLKVYLNGQKIPRFIDSTITPDAYYKEIDQNTIELDQDYSAMPLSIEIIQDVAVVDASDTNTTNISQIQETVSEGFQSFVKTSVKLNATTTVGSPATGTFYSSISNRTSIPDFTQDLKARMAIERIPVQQIYQLQNEFGPNGEATWAAVNDTLGLLRCVGSWRLVIDSNGQYPVSAANLTDYVEITFYGTGLNLLTGYTPTARDYRVSVNGGSEGSNIAITSTNPLMGRNYSPNQILPVVSGLALGVNTVKIRNNSASAGMLFYGFEILTESSSIRVQPGTSYVSGKKVSTSTQSVFSYNSTFESGTLGTRGGRVVIYQKADGTIAKSVTPAGATQSNLSSANHSSEEIVRIYQPREFGAGRTDDFSRITNPSYGTSNAFSLDDGTTSLVSNSSKIGPMSLNSREHFSLGGGTSNFVTLSFVGTGLDIVASNDFGDASTRAATVFVDGTSIGTISLVGNTRSFTQKIVSGLPYGSHTVRIQNNNAGIDSIGIVSFIVYQPKKPSVPSGAIELADYNVLATYSAGTSAAIGAVPVGVIRKYATRENVYSGTWSIVADVANFESGFNLSSNTATSHLQCNHFGNGVELCFNYGTVAINATISIININTGATVNLSSYTTSLIQPGSGVTFTASTGLLSGTNSTTGRFKVRISDLPLGLYGVRFTQNTTTQVNFDYIDIITPIYSAKSNLNYNQQNTLLVGSNAISDNRNVTILKDASAKIKNVSQAVGFVSSPSTTSTVLVPVPDLSVAHTNVTGKVRITYSIVSFGVSSGDGCNFRVYVNGSAVHVQKQHNLTVGNTVSDSFIVNVPVGTNKIDLYWSVNTGGNTLTSLTTQRTLTVEEI